MSEVHCDHHIQIDIQSIPHSSQRYDTCGDYYLGKNHIDEQTLFINVSKLTDRREMLLVAIHELIEWALLDTLGVPNSLVDDFDQTYPDCAELPHPEEPGDHPDAPYYKQHQLATGIERILAAEMGVNWTTYTQHIEELSK